MDFDDIKQKAQDLKDDASETFNRAKDDVADKTDDADDKAHQEAGRLGGEAEEYRRQQRDNGFDDSDHNDNLTDDNATTSKTLDHDVF